MVCIDCGHMVSSAVTIEIVATPKDKAHMRAGCGGGTEGSSGRLGQVMFRIGFRGCPSEFDCGNIVKRLVQRTLMDPLRVALWEWIRGPGKIRGRINFFGEEGQDTL